MSTAQKVLGALAPFSLKQVKDGSYTCNSPLRHGSDSGAFSLKITSDEHGAYYDHVTQERGSLYQLATKLGVETPNTQAVASTKRAYDGLEDYAKAHGVTAEIMARAGWQEEKHGGRRALSFVTRTGKRWRFVDGNKPNYRSVNGYERCWYGLNEVTSGRLNYGADLHIVNGEASVVVAQAYGLAAACVTSGEGIIPDALLSELQTFIAPYPNARISIVLDCDETGRKSSERIYHQLQGSKINARILDLGLSKGGDIADFLALYGLERDGEALVAVRDLPERRVFEYKKRERWQIMHANDLSKLPDTSWLIRGEIPEKGLTVLYGASGVGKSFIALDYALRVAQRDTVIYMAGEGEAGYNARIQAWKYHHALGAGKLFMCIGAVSLLDENDASNFMMSVAEVAKNPKFIIVDTLARSLLGGDENSARDMGLFIDKCNMLQQYFSCAVMIVHHTNKGGVSERGSGSLRGASDSMIRVSDDDGIIVVECAKTKDSKPFDTKFFTLNNVDVGMFDSDGNKVMPAVAVPCDAPFTQTDLTGLTRNQRKVLETALEVFGDEFTVAELCDVLPEIDKGSMFRIVGRLKKLGYIEQPARRDPYAVTDKARELLEVAVVAVVAVVHEVADATSPSRPETRATSATIATTATTGRKKGIAPQSQNATTATSTEQISYLSGSAYHQGGL